MALLVWFPDLSQEEYTFKNGQEILRKIAVSTVCTFCDAPIEDIKHYFLYCPSFSALRDIMFVSVVHLLGDS